MASLLPLIKTWCLSRRKHDTVLHRVHIVINQHVIAKINDLLCVTFWNHDGYVMAMVRATWRLRDEIHDVLRRDNFVAKTDINLMDKTTNLATHG